MTESKEMQQEVTGAVGKPILTRVVRQGLSKKMPFQLRPESKETAMQISLEVKAYLYVSWPNSKCKGPEAGAAGGG